MKYPIYSAVSFVSNQPVLHLHWSFGNNDLTDEDFEELEYVGIIKGVSEDLYFVMTMRPYEGFLCSVQEQKIIRILDPNELSDIEVEYVKSVKYNL